MPPTSHRIEFKCPVCHKRTEVASEIREELAGVHIKTLACGHTITEDIVALPPLDDGMKLVCAKCLVEVDPGVWEQFNYHDTHCDWQSKPALIEIPSNRLPQFGRMMHFQMAGVEFLERANYSAALCDEQGLGKTVQVLQAVAHQKAALTPTLYVVKASLRLNWLNEMVNNGWLCSKDDPMDLPFILLDGRSALLPGFKHYIVPFSLLDKYRDRLCALGFKLIVVDESQNFSNMSTKRTQALLDIARVIPHKICMSGTPILNRASEYFPVLHMIKPDHWQNYKRFINQWIEAREVYNHETRKTTYKLAGIQPTRRTEFFNRTALYMLRRRKRDVLRDLPKFRRNFVVVDVSETGMRQAYNDQAQQLGDYIDSQHFTHDSGFQRSSKMLAFLMKMRHICGMAKAELCVEHANEFLESTEESGDKLIIGCHHDDVMAELARALAPYDPILLPSGIDQIERVKRIDKFKLNGHRLCIAKILAQGEGLNLQFCHQMIMLERMWNPGKEEQFEARIDRYGQTSPTTADYIVAKNTVDEDFSELVEDKRQYCGGSIDASFDFEMDSNLLGMLAEKAARRRL